MKYLKKDVYGLVYNSLHETEIIYGVVTGIRYTEAKPIYEISFGKEKWWTPDVTCEQEDLLKMLKLPSLDRIQETHGLKIQYGS